MPFPTPDALVAAGATPADAAALAAAVAGVVATAGADAAPAELWRRISKHVLTPAHPHPVHIALHAACYASWDAAARGPPPLWTPTRAAAAATNLARFMAAYDGGPAWRAAATGDPTRDVTALHRASWADPDAWWPAVLPHLGVRFDVPPSRTLDRPPPDAPDAAVWFPGARLNIAACALYGRDDDAPALLTAGEAAPTHIKTLRLGELRAAAATAGAALASGLGLSPGDAVAIIGTLNATTVALYLGAILIGAVPVSIAESFAAPEIATRLRLAAVRAVVVADVVWRGGRELPLYPRVADAVGAAVAKGLSPPAVRVFAAGGGAALALPLRSGTLPWAETVAALPPGAGDALAPASLPPAACCGLLFSSGTTGDPKCIPWTHATPIRCALDCWANLDVRPRDVLAWPTSLGWMMGPFSVFGALLPGAALALFDGSPLGPDFASFVSAARVTMLGVVPSMVRAWRSGDATRGADWGALRCFGSTGEASNPDDYAWLSARARYVPALEVCGGTELGGAYASGTLLAPWAPSTFSTPAFGAQFVLMTADGRQSAHGDDATPLSGEVALVPPSVGMSQALVGRDHAVAYYKDMPRFVASASTRPTLLRRHGDEFARLPGGACYAALGRVDDTMNVGGVKVASAEIERAVMGGGSGGGLVDAVAEVAAVGVPRAGGGPEALTLVAVAKPGAPPPDPDVLRTAATAALRAGLNPLFRVERVVVVRDLPRTATGKVMRRELRADLARGGKL